MSLSTERLVAHPRFQITEKIEAGGMSFVYRAFDRLTSGTVILKSVCDTEQSEESVRQITGEFLRLNELKHPSIPEAYDLFILPDAPAFYSMEWIDGDSLEKIIKNHPVFSESAFYSLLFQLLLALDYLNKKNIVHRDLKPSNIIISGFTADDNDYRSQVKIIDFGLAFRVSDQKESGQPTDLAGTIQYSAPEVIKKTQCDHRSDLYSLGVVMYEWLTGVNPFDADDIVKVVVNHLEKNVDSLNSRYPFIHKGLADIVLKCLNKNPDHRYQNTGEIFHDLFKQSDVQRHWDEFQRYRAFFLNESYFYYDDTILQQMNVIHNAFESKTFHSGWIKITGDPYSGKTACLNEFIAQAESCCFSVIELHIQLSLQPYFNLEQFVRQLQLSALEIKTNSGKITEPDEEWLALIDRLSHDDDALEDLIDYLYKLTEKHSRWLWLIDSEHLLSEEEKKIFCALYNRITRNQNVLLLAIHSMPPEYTPMLSGVNPIYSIVIPQMEFKKISQFIQHLLFQFSCNDEFGEFVFQRAKGNPFLIKETVRHCLQQRYLMFDGFRYVFHPPREDVLPDSVQAYMIRQMDFLPEKDLHLLTWMSLFSGTWTRQELIDTTENELAGNRLSQLVKVGFIEESNENYQITNSYLRKHLYESIQETERARRHRELAEYFIKKNQDLFLPQIVTHLTGSGENQTVLPYIIKLGQDYKSKKQFIAALEQFESAYTSLKKLRQENQLMPVLTDMISICDLIADRKKQIDYLHEMEALTEISNHPRDLITYYTLYSNYLERISAYDQVERFIQKAIQLADTHQRKDSLSSLYRMLGKSYYQRARWQDALVCYQRALSEMPVSPDHSADTEILNSIGTVYGTLRKWNLAMNAFERVLESATRIGDDKSKINALINLGYLAHRQNDNLTALNYYHQAEQMIQPVRSRKYEQRLNQYMGISYRFTNQYEKALVCFEKSEQFSYDLNDTQTLGKSLSEQSVIYHLLGSYDESLARLEQSIQIADQLNNQKDAAIRRLRLAELLYDTSRIEDATAIMNSSKLYVDQHGDDEWRIYAGWLNIKLKHKAAGDHVAAGSIDELAARFDRLIQTSLENHFDSILVLLYDLHAEILCSSGKNEKASEFSSKAMELLEKIDYFEFDKAPVLYRHYQILNDADHSRQECGGVLEKAHKIVSDIEISLTRSGLKEHYHFKPVVQKIRESYRMFFKDELQFQVQSFNILFDIAKSINGILETEKLFKKIMDEAVRHSGADRGLILIRDEEDDSFEIKTARHIDPSDIQDVTQISQSIVQEVYRTGLPLVTADAQTDDRFKERQSVMAYHIRSIMCVPLKIKERIVGAVYVDKQFDSNYFSTSNIQFLESFANLAAIAIENARLYQKVQNEKDDLQNENTDLRQLVREKYMTHNIVGRSKRMMEVFKMIERSSASTAPVIIEGESGTGKELVAKAIHFNGDRKGRPFIAVDCGSLPETLLESELFGYKKGAFTGAVTDKKGLFEEADGGTIFLDEITNTTLNFQSKLLRVLQEGEIRRVGDSRTRKLDVRIISATNRNLNQEVQQSRFREDLYYRLNVLKIQLPPLRERKDDIPPLIHFLMQKYNEIHGKRIETVSPDLLDALIHHAWPGNIRELENVINRMILFTTNNIMNYDDLPEEIQSVLPRKQARSNKNSGDSQNNKEHPFRSLEDMENYVTGVEKNYFNQILESVEGNKSKAAEQLGIKRTTLNDRLKKLGLL